MTLRCGQNSNLHKSTRFYCRLKAHALVKGRQNSRNFWHDRLSGGEMGGTKQCPRRRFFCQQYEMTFRQLRNGRFSPNLATTRESWVRRRCWTEIYEKFPFRGHLPSQNPKLGGGQTGTSLQSRLHQGMHCREILFTPRCRPRKFQRSGQLFCTTYGCGATGHQNCPIFGFWPIFPLQNA